jgi:hypothetical protein
MSKLPRGHVIILACATVIALLSLRAGFFADDLLHVSILSGQVFSVLPVAPIDLFRFSPGDAAWTERMIRESAYPWWSDPHFRGAFFRPLSALTHIMDYRLWGMNPVGYHVTNILLWLLVLLAAGSLIQRLAPTPRAATLSFLIFALADARALVIMWIANRNALVATALAFAALAAWDDYRRGGRISRAVFSWILFGLALLGGETALGGLALLFGYEALRLPDRRPFNPRRAANVPFIAVTVIYLIWYKLEGYGVSGSGMYIDPTTSPGAWLSAAAGRFPTLLAGLLWGWPVDLWVNGGSTQTTITAGALVLLPASVAVFARVVRRHRVLAGVALGGVLALLPVTATFPSTRLLLLPSVAGALLIGAYLDDAWPLRSAGVLRGTVAALLGTRHVVLAPLMLLGMVLLLNGAFRRVSEDIVNSPWPADVSDRDVVLLNTPTWVSATYLRPYLAFAGRPFPRTTYLLNLSPYPATVTRTGPTTIELRFHCGEMLITEFERVQRGSPLAAGSRVDAGLFRATVLEAGPVGPKAVQFDFTQSLDHGPLFVQWADSHYQPVTMPPPGGVLELPALAQGVGNMHAPAPNCGDL